MEYKRIVCALDLSPASDEVLRRALEFARTAGARLEVVHVQLLPPTIGVNGAMVPPAMHLPEDRKRLHLELDELVGRQIGDFAGSVRTHVVVGATGAIGEQIERFAHEVRSDLIVMGSHGRSGLARLALGSVAERVVRTSERPVMIIPIRART